MIFNILMIFGIKEKSIHLTNTMWSIATNIPVLLMTGFVVQSHICSLYEKKTQSVMMYPVVVFLVILVHRKKTRQIRTVMDRYNTFKQNKHTHTLIIYITQTHLNNKHNQMNIIYITFIKVTNLFHGKEGTG